MKWFDIENKEDYATINIYDEIGSFGYSAKDFIDEFSKIKASTVHIFLNSPGGSVFEGLAIYNQLRNSNKKILIHVDGLAASIASIIAMAGDSIFMAGNSMMMIHDPTGGTFGKSEDFLKMAKTLDVIKEQLSNIYVARTGKEAQEIKDLMTKETWFTAKEALEYGLIDEITEGVKIAACAGLENYNYTDNKFKNFITNLKDSKHNNENETQQQEKELRKMELFNKIGVKDEAQAVAKFEALEAKVTAFQAENATLKADNDGYKAKENEARVDLMIAQKKILPAVRDLAIETLNLSLELFEKHYVKKELPATPPTNSLDVPNNSEVKGSAKVTYENLLDDMDLFAEYETNKPEEFAKLVDEFERK